MRALDTDPSDSPCITRVAGRTQPGSVSTNQLYHLGVMGGRDPGMPLLDGIKIGRKPDRTVILSARPQSIPHPRTGIRGGVEEDGVSLETLEYSTLTIQSGVRFELRYCPGNDQSSVSSSTHSISCSVGARKDM